MIKPCVFDNGILCDDFFTVKAFNLMKICTFIFIMILLFLKFVLLIAELTRKLDIMNDSTKGIRLGRKRFHSAERTFLIIFTSGLFHTIAANQDVAFLIIAQNTIDCIFVTDFAH